jgi:SET domain-containing protein
MSVEEADRWFARHQHQFNAQTVFQGASLGDVSFRISKSQVIVDVAVLRGQQLWMYLNSPFPDPRKANVKVAVNYTQKNIKFVARKAIAAGEELLLHYGGPLGWYDESDEPAAEDPVLSDESPEKEANDDADWPLKKKRSKRSN